MSLEIISKQYTPRIAAAQVAEKLDEYEGTFINAYHNYYLASKTLASSTEFNKPDPLLNTGLRISTENETGGQTNLKVSAHRHTLCSESRHGWYPDEAGVDQPDLILSLDFYSKADNGNKTIALELLCNREGQFMHMNPDAGADIFWSPDFSHEECKEGFRKLSMLLLNSIYDKLVVFSRKDK
jgi:hypothetical protein